MKAIHMRLAGVRLLAAALVTFSMVGMTHADIVYQNNFSTDAERGGLVPPFQDIADVLVGQGGGTTVTDAVGTLPFVDTIGTDGTLTIDYVAVRGRNDRDVLLRLEDGAGTSLLTFGLVRGRTGVSTVVGDSETADDADFVDSDAFGLTTDSQGSFIRGIIDTTTGDIDFFAFLPGSNGIIDPNLGNTANSGGDFGNIDVAFDDTRLVAVGSGNLGGPLDLSAASAVAFRTDGGGTALDSVTISFEATAAIPEPSSFAALGLIGLVAGLRRRR